LETTGLELPELSHLHNYNEAYWLQMVWHELVGGCFWFVPSELDASHLFAVTMQHCMLFFTFFNFFQLIRNQIFAVWSYTLDYKGSSSARNGGLQ
jgi:hypothetical protein